MMIKNKLLYLHIGMHKTGSTSIQNSLFNSRELLLENDINYLSGVGENHSTSLFSIFTNHPEKYHVNIHEGISTHEKAKIHNKELINKIIYEFEHNRSKIFIISGEDLTYLNDFEVKELYEFLKNYFETIEVIAYVREPISFIDSETQQRILGGLTFEELVYKPAFPHYRYRFEKYIKYFGENHVKLYLFDKKNLYNQDIVYDFLYRINAEKEVLEKINSVNINTSFNKDTVLLIEKLNSLYPMFNNNKLNLLRGNINRELLKEAERECKFEKFVAPKTFNVKDLNYINEDINYINQYMDGNTISNIEFFKNMQEKYTLNRDFLVKLINVLNLKIEKQDKKVKQLESVINEDEKR